MNYRYWKKRCQAEKTDNGGPARQLFYEGTLAYKTGDFPKAAENSRKGSMSGSRAERLPDVPR